jgi:chemotaxis methyl-accepting protein methylase
LPLSLSVVRGLLVEVGGDIYAFPLGAVSRALNVPRTEIGQVRFVHGNLFDAGLLSALPPYDFVFCRNLLIYFDSATQTRALAVLTRLVRRDGAIFVGPAEASLLTARGHPALPPSRAFAFAAASGLLKRRIGLDCASIGQAAVLRAVRLRMQAIGEKDEAGYWSYLQASEEEIRQLIEAVVVPETWFFRYWCCNNCPS